MPTGGHRLAEGIEEQIAAAARGDQQAFADLYDATSARVFGLARRILRDPHQAEEVTQEVYLQLWQEAARFDRSRGSGIAWLMTLAHRRAVDRVRSAEAARRRDQAALDRAGQVPHDETAAAVETGLERASVHQALAALASGQREALELAYFGGHTHTEVATLLGIPLGTAKGRIRDGLRRLRDLLEVSPA